MEINEAIEAKLRTTFAAALDRDPKKFQGSVDSMISMGAESLVQALGYSLYICAWVALDVMDQDVSDDGLLEMAEDIYSGNQDWVDVGTVDQIKEILRSAIDGESVDEEIGRELIGSPFIMAGYMLSRYRRDGQRWYEFLDEAWNAAEQ